VELSIGGVNEKIEGFFQICKMRGLDGSHGVMIPVQNIISERLESNPYNSVLEALSPSTPLYNCSKHILAVKHNGISCANNSPNIW